MIPEYRSQAEGMSDETDSIIDITVGGSPEEKVAQVSEEIRLGNSFLFTK